MRFCFVRKRFLSLVSVSAVVLMSGLGLFAEVNTVQSTSVGDPKTKIAIDYPLEGSVFPPEITSPTFLWHDENRGAKRWVIEISFGGATAAMRIDAAGELLGPGEIDPNAGPMRPLTPVQASTRTWRPTALVGPRP